ncbi:hypothetical protein HRbin41_01447 [bacterium HR41]|nr:hypothetical protein HRbin41_01447 [bacterium HR41]
MQRDQPVGEKEREPWLVGLRLGTELLEGVELLLPARRDELGIGIDEAQIGAACKRLRKLRSRGHTACASGRRDLPHPFTAGIGRRYRQRLGEQPLATAGQNGELEIGDERANDRLVAHVAAASPLHCEHMFAIRPDGKLRPPPRTERWRN